MPIGFPLFHYGFQSKSTHQEPTITSGPQAINVRPTKSPSRYEVLGVHGFGTFRNAAINSPSNLSAALTAPVDGPAQISAELTGSVTIYLKDTSTGEHFVIPDPLGGGIVFYWRNESRWALSSSLPDLVAFLGDQGVTLHKSVRYTAALAVVGNGGLYDSPYDGVSVLSQFTYARCTREGALLIETAETQSKFFNPSPFTETTYWQAVELAANAISENVAAYCSHPAINRIAHLTGGMDSRTIVAALARLESINDFSLYAGGDPQSADVIIANKIAGELGVPTTRFSGVRRAIEPPSPEITAQWAMHETGGVLAGPAHVGLQRGTDTLVLSGGYGELLRGFYVSAYANIASPESLVNNTRNALLGAGAPANGGDMRASIFSASLIERAETIASSLHDEAANLGLGDDAIPEYTYLRLRNRYYVGEIARSLSPYVLRADPLYHPKVIRLAFNVPRTLRLDNYVQLDLMSKLDPRLARLPFDTRRVTDGYIQHRKGFSPASFTDSAPPASQYYSSDAPYWLGRERETVSTQALEIARKLGLPSQTVTSSEVYRRALVQIRRDSLGTSDLEEAFNVPVFDRLIERPAKWRPQYRLMRSLYNAITWYIK